MPSVGGREGLREPGRISTESATKLMVELRPIGLGFVRTVVQIANDIGGEGHREGCGERERVCV